MTDYVLTITPTSPKAIERMGQPQVINCNEYILLGQITDQEKIKQECKKHNLEDNSNGITMMYLAGEHLPSMILSMFDNLPKSIMKKIEAAMAYRIISGEHPHYETVESIER